MSARRPSKNRPAAFEWSAANRKWCEREIARYPEGRQASCVIPFLWRGQKQEGWVSIPMMEHVARQLEMPYIRVYEVATFYTMFNLAPVGEHHVQVCGTTPCMLRGSRGLNEVCERVIGEPMHATADGKLSWLEVECLGACVNAPVVQVSTKESDHFYEDLTPEILEDILMKLRRGEKVKSGSQHPDRHASEPAGGAKTLTDPALYDGSAARPIGELPNAKPAAPAE
ncbi:MAG TPA: NADH-quinone oxidoreductase subunit NuoE [Parvularculaceae bacterium]|nr:NADH-quinone oxidoreductase subunit NuoE [Parvularculaceae bacterium]